MAVWISINTNLRETHQRVYSVPPEPFEVLRAMTLEDTLSGEMLAVNEDPESGPEEIHAAVPSTG